MTSSSRMPLVHLASSELYVLDTLANTLLLQDNLSSSAMNACELLRTHGFARVRNVTKHGQPSVLAFDITDEGKTYLIRQYKNRGAHV